MVVLWLYAAMHWLITSIRCLFSRAAATRSLSANCLLTAISEECVPGVISTTTLKRGGRARSNLTRIDSPIKVAILQCGIVGVKLILMEFFILSKVTRLSSTTCSSSSVRGCSGSFITRIRSVEIGPNTQFSENSPVFLCIFYRKSPLYRKDRPRRRLHLFP